MDNIEQRKPKYNLFDIVYKVENFMTGHKIIGVKIIFNGFEYNIGNLDQEIWINELHLYDQASLETLKNQFNNRLDYLINFNNKLINRKRS